GNEDQQQQRGHRINQLVPTMTKKHMPSRPRRFRNLLPFKQDANLVLVECFPSWVVLQHVNQPAAGVKRIRALRGRKENIPNLVLVENSVWFVCERIRSQQIQVILQNAGIFEDVNTAVNEVFNVGVMPSQIATPKIKIQNVPLRGVRFQIGHDAGWISFLDRRANLGLVRPIVCHRADKPEKHDHVQPRSFELWAIRRKEIQYSRQDRRYYDSEQD